MRWSSSVHRKLFRAEKLDQNEEGPSKGRRERACQVGIVMPDNILRQGGHERNLIAPADGRQLERAESNKRRGHPAHHSSRLVLCVAAAMRQAKKPV